MRAASTGCVVAPSGPVTISCAGAGVSSCHITVIDVGARSCRYGPFSIFGPATATPVITQTRAMTRIIQRRGYGTPTWCRKLPDAGGLAIPHRRQRPDEIARGVAGVAVPVDQRRQGGLGAGFCVHRQAPGVAGHEQDEVGDPL